MCAVCGCIFDQVQCARGFRGDCDQADVTAGGLLEALEQRNGGRLDVGRRVHAALGVGDEWAFEMDSDWLRGGSVADLCGRVDGIGDAFESVQGAVDGRRYRGRKIMCNSFGSKKAADVVEGLRRAFHCIVAGRAVDVDIEEGGGKRRVGGDRLAGFDAGDGAIRGGLRYGDSR